MMFLLQHEKFLPMNLDDLSAILAEKNPVPDLDFKPANLAVVQDFARAHRDDLTWSGFSAALSESRC